MSVIKHDKLLKEMKVLMADYCEILFHNKNEKSCQTKLSIVQTNLIGK